MSPLRLTLLSDGSSDQVLIPILVWLLRRHGVSRAIQPAWADLRRLRRPPQKLVDKVAVSLDLFPCDLLFVHRDAEGIPYGLRKAEIVAALAELRGPCPPAVCVVPVRMQEAWLLFDEVAIRHAAGNPNGQQPLDLPRLQELELLPDPKQLLHELLREASGLRGRRRKKFSVETGARRMVEFVEDFSPLLELPAFRKLDEELRGTVHGLGSNAGSDQPET
jgi:hypothetical protein